MTACCPASAPNLAAVGDGLVKKSFILITHAVEHAVAIDVESAPGVRVIGGRINDAGPPGLTTASAIQVLRI